ncbi:hypothetical protein LJC25_02055 [Bacteroidales bacterium OttesenSCG-928-K03]|nr:hypothetical protein [Bacteroidales bacterium OttesenSCG-928-L14]MDL2240339.1 hypothetical protein [Bacteroidales bacterium OttesenSCG-928-K22]MDL2242492.1 hypothetical protein [Bacteroidales bacterium OttesenSCG-928-K03]
MKKIILVLAVVTETISVSAQSKFEVKDFGSFKIHSYVTADPLGDMSYIIEGKKSLVVLEPVLFHANIKEFGEYVKSLKKPIEKVIASYHTGGFNAFDPKSIVMIEGMPEFEKGEVYSGMMAYFASTFGESMDSREHGATATVGKNEKVNWAGVDFQFFPGSVSDFPAASVLIGGKVYYLHFAPVANMHMGALQITGREAVSAYLTELENAKKSGATLFVGGHGIGTAEMKDVDFQIAYLKNMKELISKEKSREDFIAAMKKAYPNLAAENNLQEVAGKLYQ